MLNTIGVSAARSGFLAGFSYYELSRCPATVPSYPILLLGAFTLSVVSGALW